MMHLQPINEGMGYHSRRELSRKTPKADSCRKVQQQIHLGICNLCLAKRLRVLSRSANVALMAEKEEGRECQRLGCDCLEMRVEGPG